MRHSATSYRPDVDGLRALAVGSVLLFHLELGVAGGFTGVDVFFVISGFLITGIISRELAEGRFTIRGFYDRRIRRIFPALFVVLLAGAIAGICLLLPAALTAFGKSLLSTLAFVSNQLFSSDQGYFSAAAESKPLLHTWSLAVEEQFYLGFPLLLMALARWAPGHRRLVLSVLWLGSFTLAVWWVKQDATTSAFYLFPARAWELLTGALLTTAARPAASHRLMREALGTAGLALIVCGFFWLGEETPFPGFYALLPCGGAALIIASGAAGDTLVYRVLSLKPLVFLGLISYSLYLWHWPLIVFFKESLAGDFNRTARVSLLISSLALAALSWRFIETPFRRPQGAPLRLGSFQLLFSGTALLMLPAFVFVLYGGLPQRLPAEAVGMEEALGYDAKQAYRDGTCFISSRVSGQPFDRARCLMPAMDRRNVVLVGDSHSAHLWHGLSTVFSDRHFMQASATGCQPLLVRNGRPSCHAVISEVLNQFIPEMRPDAVIIAARWRPSPLGGLIDTVKEIQRYSPHVIVMGRINEYRHPLPQLLALSMWRQDWGLAGRWRGSEAEATDSQYKQALVPLGIEYVSLQDALCTFDGCITRDAEGQPIQFDYGHLTAAGSKLLITRLKEQGFAP